MKLHKLFSGIGLIWLISGSVNLAVSQEEARLLRFPAIHGNQVVFTYAGDLYTVDSDGGTARRLTSHNGFEMFARFSPDGQTIAFTGQYDGNTEVFLIPASGGIPQRLTFTPTLGRDDVGDRMGPNNIVMSWTPDGQEVVFRSRMRSYNDFKGHLFRISVKGGIPEQLPFSVAGFHSFSPDGKRMAFNRVFREFRTWKYYQGGMADDIRIFDFDTKQTQVITDHPGQDIFPMWHEDRIYFLSDRDRTMNLFVYDLTTRETSEVTRFTDFDIKFPSIGDQYIVFEKGGYLFKLHLDTHQVSQIPVTIRNDFSSSRDELISAAGKMTAVSLSPKAKRLVISARGEVFNVPSQSGITHNLTQSSGVHERNASWSPDGKTLAWLSDETGEFEIHLQDALNPEQKRQLTKKTDTYIFGFKWSPDSKSLAYHDKKFRLWIVDVESGKTFLADESRQNPIRDYSWSPDSKYLVYVNPSKGMDRISLYDVENRNTAFLTDEWYNSGNPVFSSDGQHVFFVSARDFSPDYSRTEWNHIYQDMNSLYMITLAQGVKNPLGYQDDQIEVTDETEKEADTKSKEAEPLKVDLENISQRILRLPVPAGEYFSLAASGDQLFYLYTSSATRGTELKSFSLKTKKEVSHGQNLSFDLTPDGKKMVLMQGRKLSIVNVPSGPVKMGETIDLSNLQVMVNKQEEWKQVFDESWRHMRDFFYDPNLHGVNWKKMHEKYSALLPHVQHRSDLSYLIGELIGELNVGHAYVNNGERPMPERIQTGMLGAQVEKDASGYFRINRILKGASWSSELRSPLAEPGMSIREGDLILAVNGIPANQTPNLYSLLVGKSGDIVELTIGKQGDAQNKEKVLVKPLASESALYYYNWVQQNIDYVSQATNGQVGYIHIPDMGVNGLNEFIRHYYPQLTKKALIIDDRGNGGGNVSPMIIERLKREITYATMHTNQKEGSVNPVGTMAGPKVALIDQYSASDGDLFPYRFKHHQLGKVIGVRTWGGVVGYSGAIPCIDGGSIITPSYAPYAADGSGFIIEGFGVEPDLVVDNEPYEEFIGKDRQLDKAIEVILEELKSYNKTVPPIPDFPVKNK